LSAGIGDRWWPAALADAVPALSRAVASMGRIREARPEAFGKRASTSSMIEP
jgi:hypothetical protein